MKLTKYWVLGIVAVLGGCGLADEQRGSSVLSRASSIVVKDPSGNTAATISSEVELEDARIRNEGGWQILSWTSSGTGKAVIHMTTGQVVDAHVSQGTGVVLSSAGQRLLTSGAVSGSFSYVCGPQGARCFVDIPPLVGDLTYPCGPQGAVCRVTIPGV